jgi:sulfate transport system ATP-binding protein
MEEKIRRTPNMYVEMKDICKTFDGFQASDHVSFGIEKGQMAALLGPSGSGKTTILRMLAGLDRPDSGDIMINGFRVNDLPGNKRGIGFVFQNYALFRYMTVADNIGFGLEVQKKSKAEIKERVEELLELISMEDLGKRYPHQLSGGQKQRVAFARALAPGPGLLLLDEPFAAIDAKVRRELRNWLRDMIGRVGITSIFVTHDQEEAMEVANQVIIINQGKIEQIGTPEEICFHPKTEFVADFIETERFSQGGK